jgi:hypothetical protein
VKPRARRFIAPARAGADLAGQPADVDAPFGTVALQPDAATAGATIGMELDHALPRRGGQLCGAFELHLQLCRHLTVALVGPLPAAPCRFDHEALRLAAGDRLRAHHAQLVGDVLAGAAQLHAGEPARQAGGGDQADRRDQRDHQQHFQQRQSAARLPCRRGRGNRRGRKCVMRGYGW